VAKALHAQANYIRIVGDDLPIRAYITLFKWPDVTSSLVLALNDNESAIDVAIDDLSAIIICTLRPLALTYVDIAKNAMDKDAVREEINLLSKSGNIHSSRDQLIKIINGISDANHGFPRII
jgi:hypothetical protein